MSDQEVQQQPKKPISASRILINSIIILVLVIGVVGSFYGPFDMSKYVQFLGTYSVLFVPLIMAVGGGGALKNYVQSKYGADPTTTGARRPPPAA